MAASPDTADRESGTSGSEPAARAISGLAGSPPWKRLGLGFIVAAAVLSLVGGVYQVATWPDVGRLANENPQTTAFIERYRARASADGERSGPRQRWVSYDRISPNLKRAVLVAEDISFFSHNGFEFSEIKMAIREALNGGRALRGASTITQQLAKNLWLSPSRNPLRKLKEAVLTYQLERKLTKKRILEIYLNVAEFGPGVFGAEVAARTYFGKRAADLSEEEAAMLAAGLPRPSRWNPASESRWYRQYTAKIEERMDRAEFLRKRI